MFKSELKISPMHSLWDFQSGWNIALNLARVCDVSTNAVYTHGQLVSLRNARKNVALSQKYQTHVFFPVGKAYVILQRKTFLRSPITLLPLDSIFFCVIPHI